MWLDAAQVVEGFEGFDYANVHEDYADHAIAVGSRYKSLAGEA